VTARAIDVLVAKREAPGAKAQAADAVNKAARRRIIIFVLILGQYQQGEESCSGLDCEWMVVFERTKTVMGDA
jgi:hypothetical protein